MPFTHLGDRARVARAVVDHEHVRCARGGQAAVELGGAVADGHDDRCRRVLRARGHGVGEAGVDQAAGERGRRRVERGGAGIGEPHDPARGADEHASALVAANAVVEDDGHRGDVRHIDIPPSYARSAPVVPRPPGPASHAMKAATSSGSNTRSIGIWRANDAADSSP